MERPDLADDPRFASVDRRRARREELDGLIAAWTSQRAAPEVEALLQARGVPASVAQTSTDLYADPQLQHRGHFVEVAHPVHGTVTVESSHFILSRTPARVERPAPTFGQHNQHILEQILGYNAERIAALAAAGALQ